MVPGLAQSVTPQSLHCLRRTLLSQEQDSTGTMADLTSLFMALIWPGALLISVLAVSRTVIVVARSGIRVEIFTRQPILISTGNAPLRAEVGKVRI